MNLKNVTLAYIMVISFSPSFQPNTIVFATDEKPGVVPEFAINNPVINDEAEIPNGLHSNPESTTKGAAQPITIRKVELGSVHTGLPYFMVGSVCEDKVFTNIESLKNAAQGDPIFNRFIDTAEAIELRGIKPGDVITFINGIYTMKKVLFKGYSQASKKHGKCLGLIVEGNDGLQKVCYLGSDQVGEHARTLPKKQDGVIEFEFRKPVRSGGTKSSTVIIQKNNYTLASEV